MITAVIGPAGSGKTTFLGDYKNDAYRRVISADEVVSDAYNDPDVVDFILDNPPLNKAYYGNKINKNMILNLIIADVHLKEKLENFFFEHFFLPEINKARESKTNLIIDGIMPRFLPHFDQVVYIEMREADRTNNLKKRGVLPPTAEKLIELQKGLFNPILGDRV
jgi:dephospho-CoA kinase